MNGFIFAGRKVCAVMTLASTAAAAAPISYVHSGTGSGSIGDLTFTNAVFTITSYADTALRESCEDGCYFVNNNSSKIDIAGVGEFAFLTPTRTFANRNAVGFGVAETGRDLFDGPWSQALVGYDLASSIGPIAGDIGNLVQWNISQVKTNAGILNFAETGINHYPVTFSAVLMPVPEPAGYSLMMVGLVGVVGVSVTRRKA